MIKNLLAILLGVLVSMLALLILEGGVRFLRTDINHQDTERALFKERAFGNSVGWLPNASGVSFGQRFHTDKDGFRKPEHQPDSGKSWVILGDSVAFGVGVENDSTFVSLMQQARPDIRILNSAVVGYATENYRDVLLKVISENDVTHVVLFYCLRDIHEATHVFLEKQGGVDRVLGFLRRNSKLYMLMKNIFSDRSKIHFQNDFHEYEESNPRFIRTVRLLTEINDILAKKEISFQVVMLPYEYQLRKREQGLLKPQETIAKALPSRVQLVDLYACLSGQAADSRDLFLYADAMHFSKAGHSAVFNCLKSIRLGGKLEFARAAPSNLP